ncbi:MAG: hypothetical protein U0166_20370 [Acidobacteriota bacterium]
MARALHCLENLAAALSVPSTPMIFPVTHLRRAGDILQTLASTASCRAAMLVDESGLALSSHEELSPETRTHIEGLARTIADQESTTSDLLGDRPELGIYRVGDRAFLVVVPGTASGDVLRRSAEKAATDLTALLG